MGMLNPELAVRPRLELDYDGKRDSEPSLPTGSPAEVALELRAGIGSPVGPRICP